MAVLSKPAAPSFPYDLEWAENLVGLRMAVPEFYWPGYKTRTKCRGKIAFVDVSAPDEKFFALELDNERGAYYGMPYDNVATYADTKHQHYARYRLPAVLHATPSQESAVTA